MNPLGRDTPKTKRTHWEGMTSGGPLESCRVGGRLRESMGESVSIEAESPSRGRKPLPQAGSRWQGNEIIHQMRR